MLSPFVWNVSRSPCHGIRRFFALIIPLLGAVPTNARAAVPDMVPVQGYLTSQTGTPVTGPKSMTFRVYGSLTGTDKLHEESQDVEVSAGYFTVYLHPTTCGNGLPCVPGGAGCADQSACEVRIFRTATAAYVSFAINSASGVTDGNELIPRLPLGLSPYSGHAAYSDQASYDPSTSQLVTSSGTPVANAQEAIDSVVIRISATQSAIQTLQGKTAAISADVGGGAKVSNGLNVDGGLTVGNALTGPDLVCQRDAQVGGHLDTGTLSVANLASGNAVLVDGSHQLTTTGIVPVAQLGSGQAAASKYLRGDGTWRDLGADDHAQYALLAGRSGGQTLIGGTAASSSLTLQSTSNATRGMVSVSEGASVGTSTLSIESWNDVAKRFTLTNTNGTLTVAGGGNAGNYLSLRNGTGASQLDLYPDGSIRALAPLWVDANPNFGATDFSTAPWSTKYGGVWGWNRTNFAGESAFVSLSGGGADGGFSFYDRNTQLLRLFKNGTSQFGGNAGIGEAPSASGHYPLVLRAAPGYNTGVQVDANAGTYSANLVLNSGYWNSITAPLTTLAISGAGGAGNGLTLSTNGNQFTGAVGIGVAPVRALHVSGDAYVTSAMGVGAVAPSGYQLHVGNARDGVKASLEGAISRLSLGGNNAGDGDSYLQIDRGTGEASWQIGTVGGTHRKVNLTSTGGLVTEGNVGIGAYPSGASLLIDRNVTSSNGNGGHVYLQATAANDANGFSELAMGGRRSNSTQPIFLWRAKYNNNSTWADRSLILLGQDYAGAAQTILLTIKDTGSLTVPSTISSGGVTLPSHNGASITFPLAASNAGLDLGFGSQVTRRGADGALMLGSQSGTVEVQAATTSKVHVAPTQDATNYGAAVYGSYSNTDIGGLKTNLGNLVRQSWSPQLTYLGYASSPINVPSLTASRAVATDASNNLVSLDQAVSNTIPADVSTVGIYTYKDVASISLGPGTWSIIARMTITSNNVSYVQGLLYDSTAAVNLTSTEAWLSSSSVVIPMPLNAIVTLSAAHTIVMRLATTAGTATAKATTVFNSAGPTATNLTAVRLY